MAENLEGYRPIPGHERWLLSTTGQVYDSETNQHLELKKYNGYPAYNLPGIGTRHLHRLLCMTYKEVPEGYSIDELEVNHIDGDKENFALDNLEWATVSWNVEHAYRTGLRSDNKPLLVKNLMTGEVSRYYSLQECARFFRRNGESIFRALKRSKVRPVYHHFLIIEEGEDWPDVPKSAIADIDEFERIDFYVEDLTSGKRFIVDDLAMTVKTFGLDPDRLKRDLIERGYFEDGKYLVRFLTDIIGDVQDARRIRKDNVPIPPRRQPKPLRALDTLTGEEKIYPSAEEFARKMGSKKNTIQKSIWKKGGWRNFKLSYVA